jgi:DNA polymerase III gamma/tau subunit
MLTKEAWNAALKTIEEPPKNVLFIFCTTELQKVIPTIKSRCVPIQFPGVHDSVVSDMLRQILKTENVPYDEESIALIAKYAYGSIRDAQSILEGFIRTGKVSADQVKHLYQTIDPTTILTYFNNILGGNIQQATNMATGWLRLGAGPELIVSSLLEHLRNMVMDFIVTDSTIKGLLKVQREKIGESRLVQWIEFFYTQLRFIREFPMEHTLIVDLITIKLIGTLREPAATRTRKSEAKEETGVKKEEDTTMIPVVNSAVPLDKSQVDQLVEVCGGSIVEVQTVPKFFRATIRNHKGTKFDVVSEEKYAKSDLYIKQEDLEYAIKGYPASMESAIKSRR